MPLLSTTSLRRVRPLCGRGSHRRSRRMPPADAERVARRVCVDLMAFRRVEVARLEQAGTKFDCLLMGGSRILDVEVEMDLLRGPIGPVGRNVFRRELDADRPFARGGDDAVKTVVPNHDSTEHPSPERALGIQVGGIEHDHLSHHLHGPKVAMPPETKP